MDWRSITFDWNRARAFLVTAEEGSLSAAARALNMTQPTLGRQVAALEKELGTALFERGGKGLELTPAGLALLDHVRAMGEAANSLSLAATGQSDSLEGSICITATEAMAAFILPSIVKKLRDLQPGIQVELIASNATNDLRRREADIAIRAYRPTQPDLIARKIGDVEACLYATPTYMQSIDAPGTAAGLNHADYIGLANIEQLIDAYKTFGLALTVDNFSVITENHIVHWELTKHGLGIGVMVTEVGDAESAVERVLPQADPFVTEIWLVAHRELRTNRRVRTVFNFLVAELS